MRYIEATKCAEVISERLGIRFFDLLDVFAEIPSADVVPKTELEELLRKYKLAVAELEANVRGFTEVDILKSLITRKEDEAYKKGYNDAIKDIEEFLRGVK